MEFPDGYKHEHDKVAPYQTLNNLVRLHRQATLLASLTSFETVAMHDANWSKQVADVWEQIAQEFCKNCGKSILRDAA